VFRTLDWDLIKEELNLNDVLLNYNSTKTPANTTF